MVQIVSSFSTKLIALYRLHRYYYVGILQPMKGSFRWWVRLETDQFDHASNET